MPSKLFWHVAHLLVFVVMFAFDAGYAPIAHAKPHSIIRVGNGGDGPANPLNCDDLHISTCRLRDAIAKAGDWDTIIFYGDYTIQLTSELVIAKNLTIDGTGHTITLDGQDNVRVFMVRGGFTPSLNALTITHGSEDNGGGIYVERLGSVEVRNCILSNNSAWYGGGIYLDHPFIVGVTNSTFAGNRANYGGGIYLDQASIMSVTNSTFTINSATFGGGIYNNGGTLNITNSTFSDNGALSGGGIYNNGDTLNITNSTFSGNHAPSSGASILNLSTIILKNTILANRITAENENNCSGTITDGGGNLDISTTCGFSTANGSFPSTDPQLGALTGSPAYLPLNANSSAIDAGNAATCAAAVGPPTYGAGGLDQRGQLRNDLQCDIGAYERVITDGNYVSLTPSTMITTTYGPARAGIKDNGSTHPGVITATKVSNWGGGTPAGTLGAWWELSAPTTSGLSLGVKLCYSTTEQGNLIEDGTAHFWRYNGSWNDVGAVASFSGSTPNRCAQITGVTNLSRWTIANSNPGNAPTAVTLSSFKAIAPSFDLVAWFASWFGK